MVIRGGGYSFDLDRSTVSETDGKYEHHGEITSSPHIDSKTSINSDMEKAALEHEVIKTDLSTTNDSGTSTNSSSFSDDKKTEDKEEPKMVGVTEVFRFATATDKLLMLIGLIGACTYGSALPMLMIVFGNMSDIFIYSARWDNFADVIAHNISSACIILCDFNASFSSTPWPNGSPFCTFGDAESTERTTIYPVITVGPGYEVCSWCWNVTAEYVTQNIMSVIAVYEYFGCTDQLAEINENLQYANSDLMVLVSPYALYFTYLGCGVIAVAYLEMMCWYRSSYNQSERIRSILFKSILCQEVGWFDTQEVGELNTRLVDDIDQIEKGIGDKLALLFQYFSAFVAGFVIGFVYGWKLTLVVVSVSPLLALSGLVIGKLGSSLTKRELAAYAKAGAVAEEVFSAIRTVTAFGGQEREAKRYCANLGDARSVGLKKGFVNGIGLGASYLVLYGFYALAFWYGSLLVREEDYTPGNMMIVFFSILVGSFSLGAGAPNLQEFANARGAAHTVFRLIDQESSINSSSEMGMQPDKLKGNVEFREVVFRYPSRPEVKVLNGFSMKVNVGQTVALVGSSGCGKSTCVQLLQRFYDVLSGEVLIDGIDIRKYNLKWLRQHIGVVSQEPVLFAMTIAENIRNGRQDATHEEIILAAKKANAHDFISQLPLKYDTLVGERGAQLSGGQKQRIAIARALVRDPKILLLDEATSALDTESEGIVQDALDKAREGRTTLVIAHRLSTIQTADIIAGVSDGVIVERGTHRELIERNGVYCALATNQNQTLHGPAKEDSDDDEYSGSGPPKRKLSHAVEVQRLRSISLQSSKSSKNETVEEKLQPASMRRLMQLNSPEWPLITSGCIGALLMGCIEPAFAIVFSKILAVFSEVDLSEMKRRCDFYSLMFAVIAVVAGCASFIQHLMFALSGEYLTTRIRDMTFRALMRKATGSRLAVLIQGFGAIAFAVILGLIYSWQLTLGLLAFAPLMMLAGFIEIRIVSGERGERNKKMEEAAKIAIEAIENIRTVATLTLEEKLHLDYNNLIAVPYNASRKKAHFIGFAFAMSQSMIFFAHAACFYLGAYLMVNEGLSYDSMYMVYSAVLFGAMAAGQATSFAPDYGKAKIAAARIFTLFDHVPSIDSSSEEGDKLADLTGSVELRNVQFHYPTRPDVEVLKDLSISIQPGQMVALVGSSGCGKSTVVQLLERFYDPSGGNVLIDDHPVDTLHLQWLRRQIGIVSQEPVLFDCSIRDNIAYGDNFRQVTMDEIIDAARKANIHNFIDTLPQGYDTNVGDKGTQLSGGQKQRIAIARALVRSPKILLLDEATSALDTESEKVVQEALERAQEGRTSIVIAHRLSTIQNADCIIVIQSGRISEIGTHSELIAKRGIYYRLNTRQRTNQ